MRFHSVHVSTWALVASLFTGLVGCGDDGKIPVPFAQALEVQEGETLSITLQGENGKTFRIVEPPAHGTLAGEPPELTYVSPCALPRA